MTLDQPPLDALWQRKIAEFIEAIPDAIAVIDAETAEYVAFNEMACHLAGRTREQLNAAGPLGIRGDPGISDEILKRRYRHLVETFPQPQEQEILTTLGDGSVSHGVAHRRAVRIAGRWLIVVRVLQLEGQARHRSETPFRGVVELSSDAVAIVDVAHMKIMEVNRGASGLLGFSQDELLERGLAIGFADVTDSRRRALFERLVAQSPQARIVDAELRRKDGSMVSVQLTQQAVDDHGRWIVILTARDITERVESQRALERRVEELNRSNRELESFAYVVSHDLMEPLRMVASYAQLLDRRYRKHLDADANDFLGFIVDGARRMKRLLDDLLAYSRAGRVGGAPEDVAVDEVLDDVLDNLKVLIEEKSATIERHPLPVLRYGRTELTQLLQNLVGNALKFHAGSRAPRVRIDAHDDGTAWVFAVSDNGIGIAPEYFERIFVIFQRLHAREAYSGTGIGLAICRKIVERHGGRIWVESEPGAGTTFRFTVPHAQP